MANISNEKALSQNGLLYFWQQLKVKLAGKVDVESGKGLSTNDYTTAEKTKLAGIEEGATNNTVENVLTSTSTTNALSANQGKVLNERIDSVVSSMSELGYGDMMKATYDADGDGVVDDATKLDGKAASLYALADGTNIKTAFSVASSRTNVASGDPLYTILGKIAKYFTDLKAVAFSGSYSDLSNQPDIPIVTNDLTNALKSKYDAAYTHSQEPHAPSTAEANVIETIKVNGTIQTITSKAVNITVPTTVASLTDAGNYALKTDLTNVYIYRGSVATYEDLPTASHIVGDVYNVEENGMNYAWNGTSWDNLGTVFTIEYVTNAEIDAILAS